jgi:hypothetical protein
VAGRGGRAAVDGTDGGNFLNTLGAGRSSLKAGFTAAGESALCVAVETFTAIHMFGSCQKLSASHAMLTDGATFFTTSFATTISACP